MKKLLISLGFVFILLALVSSWFSSDDDIEPLLERILPEAQAFKKVVSSPMIYEGTTSGSRGQDKIIGYVVIYEATAYGGPIRMITGINLEGKIVGTVIASHKDTPSFIQVVLNHDYLKQFIDKSIIDPISIDKDIDGISGATYSARGIAKAISLGSHAVARSQFDLDVQDEVIPLKFRPKEIIVLSLIVLTLIGIRFKYSKLRWVTLIGSLVFIGFQYNTPISLANIAALLMGNFPSIRENLAWYLLLIGIPVMTFIAGRNLYCYWLCPFGALQEILAKIGGGSLKFNNKVIEAKVYQIKYGIVYLALLGAFLLKSPAFAGYEPFATLFGLQGFGIQWAILPVVIFTSLFIFRFWCRFFCPGMMINKVILKLRSMLRLIKHKMDGV